jgi:hypothetical protein
MELAGAGSGEDVAVVIGLGGVVGMVSSSGPP